MYPKYLSNHDMTTTPPDTNSKISWVKFGGEEDPESLQDVRMHAIIRSYTREQLDARKTEDISSGPIVKKKWSVSRTRKIED